MIDLDVFVFTFDQLYWLLIILIIESVLIVLLITTMAVNRKNRWMSDHQNREKTQYLTDKLEERNKRLNDISESNNRRFNYINSIFMTMKDGIVVFDQKCKVILMNPSAQTYTRLGQDVFFNNIVDAGNPFVKNIMDMVQKTLLDKEINFSFFDDSDYTYEVYTSIINNKYKQSEILGVLVDIVDVTEKKRVERIRKEFVENVSHEFRTPLTLISGLIETLKMWDDIDSEDRAKALNIIDIQSNRLKRLITDLLTLSKIEGSFNYSDVSVIDIEEVLKTVSDMFAPIASRKGITILKDFQVSYPLIEGSEEFFYQAISNLLDNAIKYTGECGWVSVRAFNDVENCFLEIEDNGLGIESFHLDRIFERFYRVDEHRNSKTGGSGIGLSIVKDVVGLMNGVIFVESEVNKGTKFIIRLPIIKENIK